MRNRLCPSFRSLQLCGEMSHSSAIVCLRGLGALGNPFRFQNRKQVLKMAGLDLSADRSGKPRIRRPLHFNSDLPKMTRIKYTVPGIRIYQSHFKPFIVLTNPTPIFCRIRGIPKINLLFFAPRSLPILGTLCTNVPHFTDMFAFLLNLLIIALR